MNRRRQRGQSLVEFSIVLPLFMFMLMGIVDFGRVIWAQNSLAAAAREAARFAIVHGAEATCPVGPLPTDGSVTAPASSSSCPYPSPSKRSIRDTATAFATAGGSNVVVSVCYGTSCSGDTDATLTTVNTRGTSVTVTITSQLGLVTPALLGMTSFGVSGSSTMVVNH
jgi:Flp pilus assembly protein TadG